MSAHTAMDVTMTAQDTARMRKAARLAVAAQRARITPTQLAMSGDARAKATTLAHTTPPSMETWKIALAILEALDEAVAP